jgi:hypothetical protein
MVRRKKEEGRRKELKAPAGSGVRIVVVSFVLLFFFLLPSSSFLLTGIAQDSPLPEPSVLFNAARANIARAGKVQNEFAYRERRTQLHMNPFGRLGTGGTMVYEFRPIHPGPGYTRRLLERDGQPVTDGEVERFEQRRRRDRAQSSSAIEDTAAALDFAIDRRVVVDGRPTILVTFAPKRDAKPQTREGRLARSFNGKVWVDEAEQEVIRVEATAIDSITYGYGLIARLNEGTVVTLLREHVGDDVWLPTSIRFQGEGRALLLRKLNVDFRIEWFDYRRLHAPEQPR